MGKLEGKVAVITGATSALFLALNVRFVTGIELFVDGGTAQI